MTPFCVFQKKIIFRFKSRVKDFVYTCILLKTSIAAVINMYIIFWKYGGSVFGTETAGGA